MTLRIYIPGDAAAISVGADEVAEVIEDPACGEHERDEDDDDGGHKDTIDDSQGNDDDNDERDNIFLSPCKYVNLIGTFPQDLLFFSVRG